VPPAAAGSLQVRGLPLLAGIPGVCTSATTRVGVLTSDTIVGGGAPTVKAARIVRIWRGSSGANAHGPGQPIHIPNDRLFPLALVKPPHEPLCVQYSTSRLLCRVRWYITQKAVETAFQPETRIAALGLFPSAAVPCRFAPSAATGYNMRRTRTRPGISGRRPGRGAATHTAHTAARSRHTVSGLTIWLGAA